MSWYEEAPKDLDENVAFRVELRERCETEGGLRKRMIEACREDVLFWLSAFCWLQEPRPMRDSEGRLLPEVIPFIPWPHQEPIITTLREKLGFEDIGIEKSRGEGMTWIALLLALHDWIFAIPGTRMVTIGVASRTIEMCDTPGDYTTLFPKLDWELRRLPGWMIGEEGKDWVRNLRSHTFRNFRNDSVIGGYAGTGELGSSMRCTYWIIDELSKFERKDGFRALTSTQQTSHSRLFIGTPYGTANSYHKIMHEPSSMIKLILQWQDNPTRNRGLYKMVSGVPVAVDPATNPLPPEYNPPNNETLALLLRLRKRGYRLDKGVRSPWYDRECDRANANPFNIAQELDRDYGGSMFRVFTEDFFEAASEQVRAPFCRVSVDYDDELKPSVKLASDGELWLWMTPDAKMRPPDHVYVVSCDLCTGAAGEYTSNSALEIIDAITGEQVGELAANRIAPDDFADLAMAICYWLGYAYLAWERNGPGGPFGERVREVGYPDVFLMPDLGRKGRRKKTKRPGWWTDGKTKEIMFSELKRCVTIHSLIIHSKLFVEEAGQYIRVGKDIKHVAVAQAEDEGPDTNENNHGDRVIAMAVGVQAMRDRPLKEPGKPPPKPIEPGSAEERNREWAQRRARQASEWDDRTVGDLMTGRRVHDF